MAKSIFTDKQIREVMRERHITRKSALKFLNRELVGKTGVAYVPPAPATAPAPVSTKTLPALANGSGGPLVTETQVERYVTTPPAEPKAAKAPKAKTAPKPATDAFTSRSAGVANYVLAGRPSKEDYVKVYGPKGPAMTWPEREAAGVDAAHFQEVLANGTCVAPAPSNVRN